ncbi:MAG: hypothetical protein FWF69_05340 [Firmicutes bacterium]|nr:hypothetical protein [Bacillota bacterium]
MKKWICLLLIALAFGCVMPQISVAENIDKFGYSSIIEEYRQAVLNATYCLEGWLPRAYIFNWEPFSNVQINAYVGLVVSIQDQFGYAFRDLNSDQQPELFLMIRQSWYDIDIDKWVESDNPTYAILAICTLTDDKTPVWCWVGGYGHDGTGDDICYLNADGTLTIDKAIGIDMRTITYELSSSGNELIVLDEIGWDPTEPYEMGFFKRSRNGEKIPISEDEYENLLPTKNYLERVGDLVFIPLSEG